MSLPTPRDYLVNRLKSLVKPESMENVIEYLLTFDKNGSQEEFEEFLIELCGQSKRHEISSIAHEYYTLDFQSAETTIMESNEQHSIDDIMPALSNHHHSTDVQDIQWPRALGGSNLANTTKSFSHSNTKKKNHKDLIGSKLKGTVFTSPITLPPSSSQQQNYNQSLHLGNIGVKKIKPKSKTSKLSNQTDISSINPCGCFATKHSYLGSCLSCGRIYCENEGPFPSSRSIRCYFCDGLVLPPLSSEDIIKFKELSNESTIRSYQLKDKLLMFDKENAKRTQVLDSQSDYYETGTWLTEEEKREMDEKERKRHEKYKVSNRKVRIAYDISGRKFVQVDNSSSDEDEDKREQDLELQRLSLIKDNSISDPRDHQQDNYIMSDKGLYRDASDKISNADSWSQEFSSSNLKVGIDYSSGSAVNNLSTELSKAGAVYRKLISRLASR